MDIEKNTTYACRVVRINGEEVDYLSELVVCEYLGIGQTKAREPLLIRKTTLPFVLVTDYMLTKPYTKRHAEMVEKFKVLW